MAKNDFSGMKVLLVEDNDFVRAMVKKHLVDFGCRSGDVIEAANGAEAIQKLMREPDLIICDIEMSPMNGFDFLDYVRKGEDAQSGLPFIFLTGSADAASVEKAISLDIDAYLLKPVNPENLKKKILQVMKASEGRKNQGLG